MKTSEGGVSNSISCESIWTSSSVSAMYSWWRWCFYTVPWCCNPCVSMVAKCQDGKTRLSHATRPARATEPCTLVRRHTNGTTNCTNGILHAVINTLMTNLPHQVSWSAAKLHSSHPLSLRRTSVGLTWPNHLKDRYHCLSFQLDLGRGLQVPLRAASVANVC
jgi:hypothetical protein